MSGRGETDDQLPALPLPEPRRFVEPRWVSAAGFARHWQTYRWVLSCASIIQEAEDDGISRVAPILVAFRARPAEVKKRIGKSAWKRLHHSDTMHNAHRAMLLLRTNLDIHDVLAIPTGALREAAGLYHRCPETFRLACGFAKNRTQLREAAMLCRDLRRMGGTISPAWGLNRLRDEHDMAARAAATRMSADLRKSWAPSFAVNVDDYRISLLRSGADFSAEGRAMRHCVASYAERARGGYVTVFRIEGRERATASFTTRGLSEIKAVCNREVNFATRTAAIKAWAIYCDARAHREEAS